MAGGVEQRDQAQKSEERAAEQVRLVFFRAVVGTAFFTDDEKGNDQDEEIADADLLHRWNFAAHTDNDLHGGERKRGQDHKEDALLFLCDMHDVLL